MSVKKTKLILASVILLTIAVIFPALSVFAEALESPMDGQLQLEFEPEPEPELPLPISEPEPELPPSTPEPESETVSHSQLDVPAPESINEIHNPESEPEPEQLPLLIPGTEYEPEPESSLPVYEYEPVQSPFMGISPMSDTTLAIQRVEIIVTSPKAGEAPNSTATGKGNYVIGFVQLAPNEASFQEGIEYTALVTIMADFGYTFEQLDIFSVFINGKQASVLSNTGTTLTLSYTFPATTFTPTQEQVSEDSLYELIKINEFLTSITILLNNVQYFVIGIFIFYIVKGIWYVVGNVLFQG